MNYEIPEWVGEWERYIPYNTQSSYAFDVRFKGNLN